MLFVVVAALGVGYVVRYQSFVRSLRGWDVATQDRFAEREFPLLDRHRVTQLGMAHRPGARPANSYTLVAREKAPGTVRIGVFGCSFVMGSEAAAGQDFPSHLQRLFDVEGEPRVEVVNFGVGAFGVQQSYLLWQYLAADFDLDLTIYDLYGFHRHRDNTFVMLNTIYAPVHGRYILDGGRLRLIEVPGDDRREASAQYFGLRPRWDMLRYDAKTPPQVRALLPHGRELAENPLYYRSDRDGEISELYGRIFADMAEKSDRLLILLNDRISEELMRSPTADIVVVTARTSTERFTSDRSSLYRAAENHPSALGYLVHSAEVHALLTGHDHASLPDVEILGATGPGDPIGAGSELWGDGEVFVTLDDRPAAVFVTTTDDRHATHYSFAASSKDSILDVSGGTTAMFVALTGAIPGNRAWLRFSIDGSPTEVEVGGISFVGGRHVGVLDRSWTATDGPGWTLRSIPGHRDALALEIVSDHEITELHFDVGDAIILAGELHPRRNPRTRRISWASARGDLVTTRGHPEQDATAIATAAGGLFCITAKHDDDPVGRWCTRRWRLHQTTVEIDDARGPITLP